MEEKLKDNPPVFLQDHIFNPQLTDKYADVFANYSLAEIKPLNLLIRQVYYREITLADFLREAEKLNLKEFRVKVWPVILQFDFLPLAEYLEIKINDWLKYLPTAEEKNLKFVDLNKWLDDFFSTLPVERSVEEKNKVLKILQKFLQGHKNEQETIEALGRSEKLGGIEMIEEEVGDLLEELKKMWLLAEEKGQIVTTQKISFIELGKEVYVLPPPETVKAPFVPTPKRVSFPVPKAAIVPQITPLSTPGLIKKEPLLPVKPSTDWKKDAEELQKSSLSPIINSQSKNHDQIAEEIIKKSGVVVPLDLFQRFKMILVSRLKEVRKQGEVKERLTAHTLNGGLGLAPEAAAKVLSVLEDFHQRELSGFNQMPKQEKKIPFAPSFTISTAVSSPVLVEEKKSEIKPISKPVFSPPATTSTVTPPKLISPIANPKITPSATSSDIAPVTASAVKITEEKGRLQAQKIAPPAPAFRPSINAVPQTPSGRAKVEDIAYTPRLIGPVEELKEMSLLEFRRLSPKPQTAADKILSKIDLLTKENYNKKIQGIEAWRRSALIQNYNAILSASLNQGKPIVQILKENQGKKQETLSEEEFKVIMELNRRLQF
ncbi:MAG: hypothetical protein UT86_C0002G0078 [Candidatus Magasanikbacteria bacterium GW2011_GWC2_40_17]|uniref:Uncharacterized protein n=1 Tax=Candidatus Magasanikbacteria bacterium GW2011_GWA2_42_32 TaxID=1619039 RepID=A0A0G1A8J1_9BACT|nr:MAG: hypothetical protein UT86_C0002G0078 [Candidatus Magasanikbacteria bacterium GW2011_GWC2_40_17]KKS57239.1 MAG: hypothetical protein UV20_C0002G0028 [Candidatus Magasanikbacteria bacterium GW2011_GWA2_42_32]OGH86131.1 MAG: hypothetical protein A2294_02645 [Candidatus Magasanikbacteria bacterium RIFOXYB2_FULL_38_10]